jgi:AcrR family transcriptional regulator
MARPKAVCSRTMNGPARPSKEQLLLRLGEDLFSRHGYKDVNIDAICEAAGFATGSFYNYFPSKEVFYARVLGMQEARGIAMADRIVAGLKSPLNQLKALYRFITLGLKRNPLLRGILTRDRRYSFPGWADHTGSGSALYRHLEDLLRRIIDEGTRQRVFRPSRYHDPVRLIITVMEAILPYTDAEGSEVLIEDILTLLERGIKRTLRLTGWENRKERVNRRRRLRASSSPELDFS